MATAATATLITHFDLQFCMAFRLRCGTAASFTNIITVQYYDRCTVFIVTSIEIDSIYCKIIETRFV